MFCKLSLLIEQIKDGYLDNLKNAVVLEIVQQHLVENPTCGSNTIICDCKGYIGKLKKLIVSKSNITFSSISNRDKQETKQDKLIIDGIENSVNVIFLIH